MAKDKTEVKTPLLNDYKRVVMAIQETLWPGRDAEFEWSADTVQEVAEILERNGMGPTTEVFGCTCGVEIPKADRDEVSQHIAQCNGEPKEDDNDDE